jgi:hypothetical protein
LVGWPRQLVIGLAWLAVALYALAPAVPRQYMPTMAMAAGMHHALPSAAHHAMAHMPDDCGMAAVQMPDHPADAEPSRTATHDCPVCKVAASAVVLVAPPALPALTPDAQSRAAAGPRLAPPSRVFSAQPRGPPPQV